MIIEPAPDLRAAMLTALRAEYATDATRPGMHLSSTIYCLTKAYWDRFDPEPPSEVEVGLWSIGFALERVMISKLHVEPITLDGITMTPDFTLDGTLADLKSTRMAPTQSDGCAVCGTAYRGHNRDELGHAYEATSRPFDMPIGWQRQFMGYRHGLNQATCKCGHAKTEHYHGKKGITVCMHEGNKTVTPTVIITDFECQCTEFTPAAIHDFGVVVMHLIPAELTTWRVWFTAGELEANWQWVLTRANELENMMAGQTPEPFEHLGYEGECKSCRYQLKCGLTASLAKFGKVEEE